MPRRQKGTTGEDAAYFALSHDLMCRIGFDWRLQRLNPALATLLGLHEDELVGTLVPKLIHPDDRVAPPELKDGSVVSFRGRVRSGGAGWRWVDGTGVVDTTSRSIWLVGVDVTGERYAERGAAAREELVTAIEEAASPSEAETALLRVIGTRFDWDVVARWDFAHELPQSIWTADAALASRLPALVQPLGDAPGGASPAEPPSPRMGGISGALDPGEWGISMRIPVAGEDTTVFEFARRSGELPPEEEVSALRALATTGLATLRRSISDAGLLASRARYRRIVEVGNQGVLLVDKYGATTYVNSRMASLLGRKPAELIGTPFSDFADEAGCAQVEAAPSLAGREHQQPLDVELRHRDGSSIWVSASAWSLPSGDVAPGAVLWVAESTTERRHAEQWFRELVEGAGQPIVVVGADGCVEYINRAAAGLAGYSLDELVGRPVETLVPEPSRGPHRAKRGAFHRAPAARPMDGGLELELRRKDGVLVPVEISLTPLETGHGAVVVAVIDDVTERRRARDERRTLNTELERRVQEATADLRAVNAELEAFSYSVSHDLRTPLRAISGFAAILRGEYGAQLPGGANAYLDHVITSAGDMGMLIDDLLEFSRLGRRALQRVTVNPTVVAREAWDRLGAEREGRPVELSLAEMPPCDADPALLAHVYENLFGNAIKYSRTTEHPQVSAGASVDESTGVVTYFVSDNGIGFDQKYAGTIFTVFQRLHPGDGGYEGTGVGLALVERIVTRHGGEVSAVGEPGHGATISFTLGPRPA